MFGFGKRNKQSYPATSKWAVLEGTNSGKVMFVRRNDSARELSKHPEYHFRDSRRRMSMDFREQQSRKSSMRLKTCWSPDSSPSSGPYWC